MRRTQTIDDEDAVAVISGYIINIGTAMLVITVLVLSLQGTVDNVRGLAQSQTLEAAGERLASQLSEADTMANAGRDAEGTVRVMMPEPLQEQGYSITVSNSSVDLASGTTNVSTNINTTNTVVNGSITGGGGELIIEFNQSHIWIV